LLGAKPDSEVARLVGRSLDAVRTQRRLRKIKGIEPVTARPWTRAEEKLLGKRPDEEVARLTGRKVSAVRTRRQRNGVPPTHFLRRPWTKEEEKLLGTDTDDEIGRQRQPERKRAHGKAARARQCHPAMWARLEEVERRREQADSTWRAPPLGTDSPRGEWTRAPSPRTAGASRTPTMRIDSPRGELLGMPWSPPPRSGPPTSISLTQCTSVQ